MVAMADLNIPDKAVRQQVASALNLVIQISRMADGTRKVTAISEITGMEQDVITMQEIFSFTKTGLDQAGKMMGVFKASGIRPKCAEQLATAGYPLPMDMFEHEHRVGMPQDGAGDRGRRPW
jgi:pilus assembly protein CpaF